MEMLVLIADRGYVDLFCAKRVNNIFGSTIGELHHGGRVFF